MPVGIIHLIIKSFSKSRAIIKDESRFTGLVWKEIRLTTLYITTVINDTNNEQLHKCIFSLGVDLW